MLNFIQENWISIVGAIIGLIYLYLEYKANIWMWAASVAMAAFYCWIFYHTQLYASMAIYIYFLLASIYGWWMWKSKNNDKNTNEDIISHTPRSWIIPTLVGVLLVFGIIYYILITFGIDQHYITIGDAFTTSLNIIALWMVSRKWVEQWLLVIPANAITALLLFAQQDSTSGILFSIFFIVSIGGYFKWKKLVLR